MTAVIFGSLSIGSGSEYFNRESIRVKKAQQEYLDYSLLFKSPQYNKVKVLDYGRDGGIRLHLEFISEHKFALRSEQFSEIQTNYTARNNISWVYKQKPWIKRTWYANLSSGKDSEGSGSMQVWIFSDYDQEHVFVFGYASSADRDSAIDQTYKGN